MILVMSLLEMKKDNTIVKRMFRYLTMSVLKSNLADIWQKYKNMYKDVYTLEVLGHVILLILIYFNNLGRKKSK